MSADLAAAPPDGMSKWIPLRRIVIAASIAFGAIVAAAFGAVLWRPAIVLAIPGLAAAWVAFILLRIRSQLSASGAGWERRIHEHVAARLGLRADSTASLLDIGCGDAALVEVLLSQSPQLAVTGVDLWASNWDYSRAACEARLAAGGHRANFRRMSAAALDFPDASFDAVVSVMCFHEVRSADAETSPGPIVAVREALRVLRPGGRFVLIDRFADPGAYGRPGVLEAVLSGTGDRVSESLVAVLDVPWPLNSRQSLGPVQVLCGAKGAANEISRTRL